MRRLLIPLGAAALFFSGNVVAADYALSPDGNAVVRVTSVTPISSASFDSTLLALTFPGWSVTKEGAVAGSSISTTSFDAAWMGATSGGALFKAAYSQQNSVPKGSSLDWVQVVTTNVPQVGQPSTRIDTTIPPTLGPLYRLGTTLPRNRTSTSVDFEDGPRRPISSLGTVPSVDWKADLYQVEYDGGQSIIVRNGVSWGWNMKPATVGTSTGQFLNPTPTCPPASCSGIGSNAITWGTGDPGSLTFAGTAFAPTVGDTFKVGTLTFHNGGTAAGSEITGIDLDISMSFDNISEANFTYHSRLGIKNTPNTEDPIASADQIVFTEGGFSAAFNILEGATASVDLMAKLTTTLGLAPEGAAQDSGDLDQLFDPVASPLGFKLTLVGLENPTGGGFISQVPEPSTSIMLMTGLIMLTFLSKRRRSDLAKCHQGKIT